MNDQINMVQVAANALGVTAKKTDASPWPDGADRFARDIDAALSRVDSLREDFAELQEVYNAAHDRYFAAEAITDELLMALQNMLLALGDTGWTGTAQAACDKARAAIARAEGR